MTKKNNHPQQKTETTTEVLKKQTMKIINTSRSLIILQAPISFEDENKEVSQALKENRTPVLDLANKKCDQIILKPVDDYVEVDIKYLQNDFARDLFKVGDLEEYDPAKFEKKIPQNLKSYNSIPDSIK